MSYFRGFGVFRGSLVFTVLWFSPTRANNSKQYFPVPSWLSGLEPVSDAIWDWTSGHLVGLRIEPTANRGDSAYR